MIQVKIYLFTVTNKVGKLADHATIGPRKIYLGKQINGKKPTLVHVHQLWDEKMKSLKQSKTKTVETLVQETEGGGSAVNKLNQELARE